MQNTPGEDCYRVDAKLPRGQEEYRNILLMNTCAQEATTHTRSIHDSTVAPSSSLHALLTHPSSFLPSASSPSTRFFSSIFLHPIPFSFPSSNRTFLLLPFLYPLPHLYTLPLLFSSLLPPPFYHLYLPSQWPSLQFLPPDLSLYFYIFFLPCPSLLLLLFELPISFQLCILSSPLLLPPSLPSIPCLLPCNPSPPSSF